MNVEDVISVFGSSCDSVCDYNKWPKPLFSLHWCLDVICINISYSNFLFSQIFITVECNF